MSAGHDPADAVPSRPTREYLARPWWSASRCIAGRMQRRMVRADEATAITDADVVGAA
jgi:hypothetical protein